jgi:hypothetical protein
MSLLEHMSVSKELGMSGSARSPLPLRSRRRMCSGILSGCPVDNRTMRRLGVALHSLPSACSAVIFKYQFGQRSFSSCLICSALWLLVDLNARKAEGQANPKILSTNSSGRPVVEKKAILPAQQAKLEV